MRERHLGTAPDRCTYYDHHQLGDGIQEVVPRLQDPNLFRFTEGTQAKAHGLVEGQLVPHMYHFVQAGYTRPLCLSTQEVVLHGTRRGTEYQKLPISAMADSAALQHEAPPPSDWHATAERRDGVVVTDAFSDAEHLLLPAGLQGMVLQPFQLEHESEPKPLVERSTAPAEYSASLPAAPHEERR